MPECTCVTRSPNMRAAHYWEESAHYWEGLLLPAVTYCAPYKTPHYKITGFRGIYIEINAGGDYWRHQDCLDTEIDGRSVSCPIQIDIDGRSL